VTELPQTQLPMLDLLWTNLSNLEELDGSGAGVKNFVGPQNSVVRGASQGRVYVTDDEGKVILDITRGRVTPVVPGRGFVAGDGRKLEPTRQQLDWIDQLWGI